MFGDSNLKSTPSTRQSTLSEQQPARCQLALTGTVALAAPAKHWAPLLLLSWGSFCIAPGCPCSWCGSWALCPAAGPGAAPLQPGLALSPASRPCRQRVVALSKARGCKQFPELPCPN